MMAGTDSICSTSGSHSFGFSGIDVDAGGWIRGGSGGAACATEASGVSGRVCSRIGI